ncbi:MAG: hypothetical protein K5659_07615 [Lachnospiraceae bacterium]|nr:hypothetical protein [Lachnospiraceae bacterium]
MLTNNVDSEDITICEYVRIPYSSIDISDVGNKKKRFEKNKTEKILNRYPKELYVLQDEVTQQIFKNGSSKGPLNRQGGANQYNIKYDNKKDSGLIILNVNATEEDKIIAEKPFGYYDWAVMEAVISIYVDAVERGLDNNGEILIDIKTIHKVLNHGKRMSQETIKNITDCKLTQSLRKLMGNYIVISEVSGDYEGDMINGELCFARGKHCVRIKSAPVLLEFAKQNERTYYCRFDKDDLKLEVTWNEERIAIYRYLMQRTNEIFGSYKNDEENKNTKLTNSIPLRNIIKTLYPDFDTKYQGDRDRGKRRDILKNVRTILDAMKLKGFFDDYLELEGKNGIVFKLIRR